ncbi:AIM24 family protein [Pimelobacter simplex]|uniref:AIM24 family protein n=1 Tax=Nocardioides simplex TaxID=2045 RepID=UPI003AAD82F3
MTAAAWHPDPTGRHELRYWDGAQWTDHVSDQGVQSTSPLYPPTDAGQQAASSTDADAWVGSSVVDAEAEAGSADDAGSADAASAANAAPTGTPSVTPDAVTAFAPLSSQSTPADEAPTARQHASEPAPFEAEQPAQAEQPLQAEQPVQSQPPAWQPAQESFQAQAAPAVPSYQPQPVGGQAQAALGDAFAGISGELIDGRFGEVDGAGAMLQNKKLLRVRITEPFMAKQGSMVAYQGNVNFAYQGGGAAKFLKKAFTGEGLSLMRVEGQGDVFLADLAHDVHILHLNNSGLSVNGRNVLAFSASLDWNVERVKGGSIAAGGLFNTTLRGTGWVAITTEGMPVVLNAAEAPTFADANALVAWSVHLQTSIRSTVSAGALIGRGSGEAFQVSFQGPGFVIVQPSEGPPIATA